MIPTIPHPLAVAAATLQHAQHDRLDASMFWVGLLFVLTPLTIMGSVLGYLWWTRRRVRKEAGGPVTLP